MVCFACPHSRVGNLGIISLISCFGYNLENYRRTNIDCAEALKLNPKNVKAWYRSARACLALDKLEEAADCARRGLEVDAQNMALKAIDLKIIDRKTTLDDLQEKRNKRNAEERAKEFTLKKALQVTAIISSQSRYTSKITDESKSHVTSLSGPQLQGHRTCQLMRQCRCKTH